MFEKLYPSRFVCWLWFFMLLSVPALSQAQSVADDDAYQFSLDEIRSFNSGLDFQIISGTIQLDPAFGFADGTYKLANVQVIPLEPPHYQVELEFARRKGMLSYRHQEILGLLYDGSQFWIKWRGNVYRYRNPQSQNGWNHSQKGKPKRHSNRLDLEIDTLKLTLEFH